MKIFIGFSTVFGTSSSYAEKLQRQLQKNNFSCICGEIDRFGQEWIRNFNGFLILFLSTTGNGESPPSSKQFHETLKKLKSNNQQLQGLKFAIMGFGSSIYPNFCGFAKEIQSLLIILGATQIRSIQYCDGNLKQNNKSKRKTKDIFEQWSKQIVSELNSRWKITNNGKEETLLGLNSKINKLIEMKRLKKSVDRETISKEKLIDSIEEYNRLPTAKVVEITQLRSVTSFQNYTGQAPRSTLHIKLSPSHLPSELSPGCVIYIYPQNTSTLSSLKHLINQHHSHHENTNIINKIIKRVNLNQLASRQLINDVFNDEECFLLMSREEKLNIYKSCLENKLLTVGKLIELFQPKCFKFYSNLKLHAPRPYSLCSWNQNQEFIELCVSTVPNGIASNFLLSHPQSLKFTVSNSVFKIPAKPQPIMMICNGSGIAPFRSIVQYCTEKNIISNGTPLKLYYGIQNQNADYYFKREWVDYQKKGLVDIKIAESRRNPEEKEYVQNIIEKDVILEHLYDKNGLVYICGSSSMAKAVKEIIIKSLRSRTEYDGRQLEKYYSQLKEKSIIVQQIFD